MIFGLDFGDFTVLELRIMLRLNLLWAVAIVALAVAAPTRLTSRCK